MSRRFRIYMAKGGRESLRPSYGRSKLTLISSEKKVVESLLGWHHSGAVWGRFDRVLPTGSWEITVERELPAKIGRCSNKYHGRNFDFRAKSSWEDVRNVHKKFSQEYFAPKSKLRPWYSLLHRPRVLPLSPNFRSAKHGQNDPTLPQNGVNPTSLQLLSFSAFLVVCDQDKKPHVGQQILKGGGGQFLSTDWLPWRVGDPNYILGNPIAVSIKDPRQTICHKALEPQALKPQGYWATGPWITVAQEPVAQELCDSRACSSRACGSRALWLKGLWLNGLVPQGPVAQGLCGSRALWLQGLWLRSLWLKSLVAQRPVAEVPWVVHFGEDTFSFKESYITNKGIQLNSFD